MSEPAPDPPQATSAAVAAAAAADVVIRELHRPQELKAAQRLFEEIWRPAQGDPPPMTAELLRALAHAGCYVAGAFAGTRLVGASAGFFTAPPDLGPQPGPDLGLQRGSNPGPQPGRHPGSRLGLHSHITGVTPGGQHRGIGFALKVHQRAWAVARGITEVAWTFDPLVARNAWFNLAKLGARPTAYLEDFYGPMTDAINAGMASDRLLLSWRLDDPAVAAACDGRPVRPSPVEAQAALTLGPGLEPVTYRPDTPAVTIALPPELEALEPGQRRAWRQAVREALGGRLAAGATVTGFLRHPDRYLVELASSAGRP